MSARSSTDLKPLPRHVQWWRRTRNRRLQAYQSLRIAGGKTLTLANSVLGGTLISFGVWSMHEPTGYIVGGITVWFLQWSHEQDKRRGE